MSGDETVCCTCAYIIWFLCSHIVLWIINDLHSPGQVHYKVGMSVLLLKKALEAEASSSVNLLCVTFNHSTEVHFVIMNSTVCSIIIWKLAGQLVCCNVYTYIHVSWPCHKKCNMYDNEDGLVCLLTISIYIIMYCILIKTSYRAVL